MWRRARAAEDGGAAHECSSAKQQQDQVAEKEPHRASKAAPTYTFKANHAEAGLTFDSMSIYIWRADSLIIIKQFGCWPPPDSDSDPTVSKDFCSVSASSISFSYLVGLQVNNLRSVQQLASTPAPELPTSRNSLALWVPVRHVPPRLPSDALLLSSYWPISVLPCTMCSRTRCALLKCTSAPAAWWASLAS